MRHRAGVFGKLQPAHSAHVVDAVHRPRAEVGAELLIAEHGQPLFQAELEPVAAGDAVAGPVMEIFMTNHALNIEVVFIGGGIGTGQNIFGVKDVQPFVLHGTHIKEVDGDNHIDVEVILEAKALLIPFHGVFQRGHRPRRAVEIAAIDVQLQRHFTPGAGGKSVAQDVEITGHQRKQVARFREWILPLYPVTTVLQFPFRHTVAVGEQERIFGFIGDNFGGKARQHVRTVQIPGDVAETFRFTLGAQRSA